MIRIFISLAIFSLLCVALALLLGLRIGELQALRRSDVPTEVRQEIIDQRAAHWLIGLAASLVVVLVNSISVTYFIGTGRWCKEVVERYALDPIWIQRSSALKRRTFPWAVVSMLCVLGVAALGAASDPATGMADTATWVMPHFISALCALALLAYSYFVQAANLHAHSNLIRDIMAEVRRVRAERGLPI